MSQFMILPIGIASGYFVRHNCVKLDNIIAFTKFFFA